MTNESCVEILIMRVRLALAGYLGPTEASPWPLSKSFMLIANHICILMTNPMTDTKSINNLIVISKSQLMRLENSIYELI